MRVVDVRNLEKTHNMLNVTRIKLIIIMAIKIK